MLKNLFCIVEFDITGDYESIGPNEIRGDIYPVLDDRLRLTEEDARIKCRLDKFCGGILFIPQIYPCNIQPCSGYKLFKNIPSGNSNPNDYHGKRKLDGKSIVLEITILIL